MNNEDKKLNWRQACEILGCSRNRFYSLIKNGHLPAYRMPGSRKGVWVYEKDCAALIKKSLFCTESFPEDVE